MELMGLATSMGNLLPELPDSPFDNDSFSGAYPPLCREEPGQGRESGGAGGGAGTADLGVDADCIFDYDDSDQHSDAGHDHSGVEDMPFAWAPPEADVFELALSVCSKSDGSADTVNTEAFHCFVAQQCMAPPVLSSFKPRYSYGRPHESVRHVQTCLRVTC